MHNPSFDFDVACLGAGSANLSVAAALEELAPGVAGRTVMLEASSDITWQRGLLIPGALSQVSFLKDLATRRDPQSRFTFLKYLHETGQLDRFLNMGTLTPFREEVSHYHRWVAEQFERVEIRTSCPVQAVQPIRHGGAIEGWSVQTMDGIVTARHIVCGMGRDARIPEVLRDVAPDRVIHSNHFNEVANASRDWPVETIAIVGSAQSAAEMTLVSGELFPAARRVMIMRSIGMITYEVSKFTNELFFPGYVDRFHAFDPADRRSVLDQMRRSNYSGVAPHTLDALYNQKYLSEFRNENRISFRTLTQIDTAERLADGRVRLGLSSSYEGANTLDADLVLLGTGFEPDMPAFVRRLAEAAGLPAVPVGRNYRLDTGEVDDRGMCFVLGVNEETHGIADSLLSIQASRAEEVVGQIASAASRNVARTADAASRTGPVPPLSSEPFIRSFDEKAFVHENGLDAKRLLPFPIVTPFEASWCVIRPGTYSTEHAHHEAEIFIAIEGEATLEAHGRQEAFCRGDVAFFRPGVAHRVVNGGEQDFVMYSIWWDEEMSHQWLDQSRKEQRRVA